MHRFDKYTLQTLGFALTVMGVFLFMIGIVGGGGLTGAGTLCLANSCPLPWFWWLLAASFFSGITLAIIGIVLIIIARGMKPRQETSSSVTTN